MYLGRREMEDTTDEREAPVDPGKITWLVIITLFGRVEVM